jgi:hypothetical protein
MGAEHADRLAGLHQKRVVALQPPGVATMRSNSPSRAPRAACRQTTSSFLVSRQRRGRVFISMRIGASVSQLWR